MCPAFSRPGWLHCFRSHSNSNPLTHPALPTGKLALQQARVCIVASFYSALLKAIVGRAHPPPMGAPAPFPPPSLNPRSLPPHPPPIGSPSSTTAAPSNPHRPPPLPPSMVLVGSLLGLLVLPPPHPPVLTCAQRRHWPGRATACLPSGAATTPATRPGTSCCPTSPSMTRACPIRLPQCNPLSLSTLPSDPVAMHAPM